MIWWRPYPNHAEPLDIYAEFPYISSMIADIVVGAVVLISALISFMRGFIREILTIIGVVGGILAAIFFGPKLIPFVSDWYGIQEGKEIPKLWDLVPMDIVASATAYGMIFLVVVIVLSVLSHFLSAGAKAIGLGPIDRTLGVIFGIARAVILLGLLYLPFHLMMAESETKDEFFKDSKTHFFIEKTAEVMASFLPDDGEGSIKKTAQESLKKSLMEQDLLKSGVKKNIGEQENKNSDSADTNEQQTAPTNTDKNEEGYKPQQRENMDKLFQQVPGYNE